jgi:hypothetical protein
MARVIRNNIADVLTAVQDSTQKFGGGDKKDGGYVEAW